MDNKTKLKQNLATIQSNIAKALLKNGKKSTDITIIAVSKTIGSDIAKLAFDLGIRDFGENRTQELNQKKQFIKEANWHMIGRLQTNKVKEVVGVADLIHSLDRWNLAEEINKRGRLLNIEVPVLVQVNIAGEEQKAGIEPNDVEEFLDSLGQLSNIKVYGLMTMAPFMENNEGTRPIFRELFYLKEKLKNNIYKNVEFKYLSMGMSQDYEIAIEEGSNMVRIGSALFDF